MAQSGHPNGLNQCPLLGVKRTSRGHRPMSVQRVILRAASGWQPADRSQTCWLSYRSSKNCQSMRPAPLGFPIPSSFPRRNRFRRRGSFLPKVRAPPPSKCARAHQPNRDSPCALIASMTSCAMPTASERRTCANHGYRAFQCRATTRFTICCSRADNGPDDREARRFWQASNNFGKRM